MDLEQMLARVHSADDKVERARAVEALSQCEGEQVILALIDALDDEDQLVQVAAAEGLKNRHPASQPYLGMALSDGTSRVRWGAAELLASWPSPESEASLSMALIDENPDVRGAAARSLRGMVREPTTIAELRGLLDDRDSFPRYQALRTLRAFDPQLVDEAQVIRRDLESDDVLTRVAAIHFIREDGRQEWLSEVEKLLDHPDFRIRRAANWAWERLTQT